MSRKNEPALFLDSSPRVSLRGMDGKERSNNETKPAEGNIPGSTISLFVSPSPLSHAPSRISLGFLPSSRPLYPTIPNDPIRKDLAGRGSLTAPTCKLPGLPSVFGFITLLFFFFFFFQLPCTRISLLCTAKTILISFIHDLRPILAGPDLVFW